MIQHSKHVWDWSSCLCSIPDGDGLRVGVSDDDGVLPVKLAAEVTNAAVLLCRHGLRQDELGF